MYFCILFSWQQLHTHECKYHYFTSGSIHMSLHYINLCCVQVWLHYIIMYKIVVRWHWILVLWNNTSNWLPVKTSNTGVRKCASSTTFSPSSLPWLFASASMAITRFPPLVVRQCHASRWSPRRTEGTRAFAAEAPGQGRIYPGGARWRKSSMDISWKCLMISWKCLMMFQNLMIWGFWFENIIWWCLIYMIISWEWGNTTEANSLLPETHRLYQLGLSLCDCCGWYHQLSQCSIVR